MTPQHDCQGHAWANESGEPLACIHCGLLWPGDDDWPPEPLGLNPGWGERGPGWGHRVDGMLDELDEVPR